MASLEVRETLHQLPASFPSELIIRRTIPGGINGNDGTFQVDVPCNSDFCVPQENPAFNTVSTIIRCIGCKYEFPVEFSPNQKSLSPLPCPFRERVLVVVVLNNVRDSILRNPDLDPEYRDQLLTSSSLIRG